jgi:hypothetical protein
MASRIQTFHRNLAIPSAIETDEIGKEFISWGKDNLYPYWLANLVDDCAIHSGIIKSKVHYTISGGLKYTGANPAAFELFLLMAFPTKICPMFIQL